MGLVGDDDDVAPVREQRVSRSGVTFGLAQAELLQGGEVDAARAAVRQLRPQIVAGADLHRLLGEQVGDLEAVEQLGVQLGAVGDDDDRGVGQSRVPHDLGGVELHLHGLAGALGVPHDAGPAVGVHGAHGGTDGFGDGEVLVGLGDAFDQAGLGGVEGGEVAVELAESFDVEHAVDEEVEIGCGFRGAFEGGEGGDAAAVVVDVPGREVVPRGERRAVAGGEVVGGDDDDGEAERHGEFVETGAQLVVRELSGGVLGARLLEFEDCQRQSVDVGHHVESPFVFAAADRHLVHGVVAVSRGVGGQEADDRGDLAAVVVDVGQALVAVQQDVVEPMVLGDGVLGLRSGHLGHCLLEVLLGHVRVEVDQRLQEGAPQDDVVPRVALPRAGREGWPGAVLPFALGEGVEDPLLGLGFGPAVGHDCSPFLGCSTINR